MAHEIAKDTKAEHPVDIGNRIVHRIGPHDGEQQDERNEPASQTATRTLCYAFVYVQLLQGKA